MLVLNKARYLLIFEYELNLITKDVWNWQI